MTLVQARAAILAELADILKDRRAALASGGPLPNDMLTCAMMKRDEQGTQAMSDEDIQDNFIGLLFAGEEPRHSGHLQAENVRGLSPLVNPKCPDRAVWLKTGARETGAVIAVLRVSCGTRGVWGSLVLYVRSRSRDSS